MAVTAFAQASRTARASEDRRLNAITRLPRAIQRAFDNNIEVLEQIGRTTFRINSGTRDDRVYNVHVKPSRRKNAVEAGVDVYCACEGAILGQTMCQHAALALLYVGRIDQYGAVVAPVKRQRAPLDEATILARQEKYLHRVARQLERLRAAQDAAQAG